MLEIGELHTVLGSSADFFLGLFYGIFSAFRRFGLVVLSKIAIARVGEGRGGVSCASTHPSCLFCSLMERLYSQHSLTNIFN